MTATITHLADFDSRPLTYAVVQPDGPRSFISATSATAVVAALVPGYDALTAALEAAGATGNRSATRKAHRALLDPDAPTGTPSASPFSGASTAKPKPTALGPTSPTRNAPS